METHYGFVYSYEAISILALNFSSYDFDRNPEKVNEYLDYRYEWHDETISFAQQKVDQGELKDLDAALVHVGYDSWISDTASKLYKFKFNAETCPKLLDLLDEAFRLYDYQFQNNVRLMDDPYIEPIYAADCALKLSNLQLAKRYMEYSRDYKEKGNLRGLDKFSHLAVDLMNLKVRAYDGDLESVFDNLLKINKRVFSEEFILEKYTGFENFSLSTTLYIDLYKKFIENDSFNIDALRHPIEWLDIRYAYIENDKVINLNLSSSDKELFNIQKQIKEINEIITIKENIFLENQNDLIFSELEEAYSLKQSLFDRLYSINTKLKSYVTPNSTHFKKFRSNLNKNEYILAYNFGLNSSHAILVSRENTSIVKTGFNKDFASNNFQSFNREIDDNEISKIPVSATLLYERYFKETFDSLPKDSTIFLYGTEFNHIPMNVLASSYKENSDSYLKMLNTEFLIKKHNFAFIEPFYSYTRKRSYNKKFLGIANPTFNPNLNLPDLPTAEAEVLRLAITSGATRNDILLGKNASFNELKKRLSKSYEQIVFSTHAITSNDIYNQQSLIISNPSTNDQIFVDDIISLNINSDLVVLSSCFPDSRERNLFTLNDSPPLTRAFLISGASSVISTTWEVESNNSALITNNFFINTWDNQDIKKYEALRNANLSILYDYSNKENIYPKNWGSFKITYKDHYSL